MKFKDHFSGHAQIYREARPSYPAEVFSWLTQQVEHHELAWDCGCGNGQASVAIAQHFSKVIATDPSTAQIANAQKHERVEYRVEPAEQSSLKSGTVDLVTIAQALHWFDLERFYADVRRVARKGAVIAALTYADCQLNVPELDEIKQYLYVDILDAYWQPERRLVEQGYRTLPFPFAEITPPQFSMQTHWNAANFLGYLRSWSATQAYIKTHGVDPVSLVEADLLKAWGEHNTIRSVSWSLAIRVGRIV